MNGKESTYEKYGRAYYEKRGPSHALVSRERLVAIHGSVPYATEHEEGVRAPFILPDRFLQVGDDGTRTLRKINPTRGSFVDKVRESTTFKSGCREYAKGHLYRDSPGGDSVLTLDARDFGPKGLTIPVILADEYGYPHKGTHVNRNRYQIRIACCFDSKVKGRIVALAECLKQRHRDGNARVKGDQLGGMWAMGNNSGHGEYVTLSERAHEKDTNCPVLRKAQACSLVAVKSVASWMRKNGFDSLLRQLRKVERQRGVFPSEFMGGKGGITATSVMSFDLGNESHFDVNDLGKSFSIWVERKPGTARNWFLCFPNMQINYQGRIYQGLRIQLFDGAVVEWDGRAMKHFTTVTEIGNGNMVNGYFFAPSRRVVSREHKGKFLRNPKGTG